MVFQANGSFVGEVLEFNGLAEATAKIRWWWCGGGVVVVVGHFLIFFFFRGGCFLV